MSSSKTARNWIVNLSIGLVSVVLSLAVAELALRSILPLRPYPNHGGQHRIPHPILGWTLRPGASYTREMLEGTIHVAYNSQGWRDVEHQLQKPVEIFRILVLGDSYMEAGTVAIEESFSRQLESLARRANYKVEVINMGVSGYGTLQEHLVFEQFGQQYAPDLVLLAFFTRNDVADNSNELRAAGERPYLDPTTPDQWQIIPVEFERLQRTFKQRTTQQKARDAMWRKQFALVRLMQLAHIRWRMNNTRELRARLLLTHDIRGPHALGVSYCQEPPVFTRAWQTTERILTQLKQDVHAARSHLAVFTVPAIVEVDREYRQKALAYVEHPEKFCFEEAPGNRRLEQILVTRGIDLIDLLPDFRESHREEGMQLYPRDDQHWNASGHALAAERVLSELIARNLLTSAKE